MIRTSTPRRALLAIACIALLCMSASRASAQAQNPSFNLVNHGASAIRELFVTPAGDARWGQNRLRDITIAAGASFPVRRRVDGNCFFDIRVVFVDGRIEDRRDVNTCTTDDVVVGPAKGAAKPADDPSFRLINRTGRAIAELYVTPAGLGNWGENRLGPGPLATGDARLISVPRQGTCTFDLRVVFADHTAKEKRKADLCAITSLPVP